MSARRSDILFLCVANSARSQLAEGWARKLAPASVEVHSAGSEPGTLNPWAVRVMAERDIDLRDHASKPLSAIPTDRIHLVVTLCAEEICPFFPEAVERLHWPLPDPAAALGDDTARLAAFRSCRDEIERRLGAIFARWPDGAADP